jgi:membrane protease subunit (stomatin/prohibitin family)
VLVIVFGLIIASIAYTHTWRDAISKRTRMALTGNKNSRIDPDLCRSDVSPSEEDACDN